MNFHFILRFAIVTVFTVVLNTAPFAQLESRIERFMAEGKVPGLFVAVVRGDSVLYQKSFGHGDKEKGSSLNPATCMELGSISKVFTAEAIYQLHSAGLLNVHDSIGKYLPNAPASWSGITIQHLLAHTSGIRNYLLDSRFHAAAYFSNAEDSAAQHFFSTITPDSMVKLFYQLPLEFSPGSTWSYSNTGYYLLGKIGEAVTGKPFFNLVKEEVTDPLHMYHTKANELAAKENCLAKGYFLADTFLVPSRVLQSNYAFSAGAWATTGQDMIRYLKAIHQRSLPSDRAGFDWRKPPPNEALPFTYNGGRFYTKFHGFSIISHNGGTPGFSSSWIYVVEKSISIIVLINRQDYAAIDQLAWDVLSYFEPLLTYPQKERLGEQERKMTKMVMMVLDAINQNKPYPARIATPLKQFLNSENGKGYWKWYFERGFPVSARCVEVEKIENNHLYRFLLTSMNGTVYQLSALVNKKGKLTQIRWW